MIKKRNLCSAKGDLYAQKENEIHKKITKIVSSE